MSIGTSIIHSHSAVHTMFLQKNMCKNNAIIPLFFQHAYVFIPFLAMRSLMHYKRKRIAKVYIVDSYLKDC